MIRRSFLSQLRRASRAARSAVLTDLLASATLIALSVAYGWSCLFPIDPSHPTLHGKGRLYELIARNPDPYLRSLIDLPFCLLFGAAGMFLLKGVAAPFALDRWKPPLENDETKCCDDAPQGNETYPATDLDNQQRRRIAEKPTHHRPDL